MENGSPQRTSLSNRAAVRAETKLIFAALLGASVVLCGAQQGPAVAARVGELLAGGKLAEADTVSTRYLSEQPPTPAVYLELGRVYFENNRWQRAADLFRKSLDLQSQNDTAHLLLGLSLAEMKQPEEAERELVLAVQQNPRSETNCYMAGRQLLLRGKYQASLPYFYKAVELNPSSARSHQGLAAALARTGNYALAVTYYGKAIDIGQKEHQESPEPHLNAAYLLLFSQREESSIRALEHARKAVSLSPQTFDAHYLCGKALVNLKRYEEALRELRTASQLTPEDARPYFLLAQVYDRLGDSKRAQDARKEFARLNKRRVDESLGMGTVP